ncbi:hypothetical protein IVB33_31975 [Bradyrhizobium sp. 24]|uniref:hypothetical protein n=1 Tax=unclassified Bradyrhizobium TaxID=2631580 RepID=UPI001FF8B636|nr:MULTISPECIES: hypothetical protein [unclassified Bradyrhizobium]MCK1297841.1 hypothetical protein [Bradyrhizobium sp. 37]MCK1381414.1 hypothetical protein [Bradyrhizobium sp. 24]MCK1771245.1 hypothetical protein [Bradyrhizobium sp. 134]
MIIPTHFGPAAALWRTQPLQVQPLQVLRLQLRAWYVWAFGRLLVFLDLMVVDLRLALATMVARFLVQAADALVRHVIGRAWRGARFAEDITAAATMVAAARG